MRGFAGRWLSRLLDETGELDQQCGALDEHVFDPDGASRQIAPSPTIEEKILAITVCLNYAISESNVYWQRNAIYFTLNSILFGAIIAFPGQFEGLVLPLVGAVGTAFNWHWPHVNRYSKYFAERWREDARAIAASDPFLEDSMRALLRRSRIPEPEGPRPSVVMNTIAATFRVIWLAVIAVGLGLLLFNALDGSDDGDGDRNPFPAEVEEIEDMSPGTDIGPVDARTPSNPDDSDSTPAPDVDSLPDELLPPESE